MRMSFTNATSMLIQRIVRRKPIGVSPKPYPGPTASEAGLTKHAGLYHCDALGLDTAIWQPGSTLGRLYPVIDPAAFERLAGSVLVGATPAIVAGTQLVAVADAQMLLAPPQLGLNACPERAMNVVGPPATENPGENSLLQPALS